MKRNLLALALISAVATQASAVLNLNLDQNEFTYTPGTASVITLVGSLTGLNIDATTFTGSGQSGAVVSIDPNFQAYLTSNTTASYFGNIASMAIPASATGIIDGDTSFVSVGDSTGRLDNEYFRVTPVPEPSAFAALGLGVVALVRRRRRA